jgi:dUTP pyrophosphatase
MPPSHPPEGRSPGGTRVSVRIPVTRVPGTGADVPLPSYATPGSSGMDLRAAVGSPVTLAPGETVLVPCGITMAIPSGFEGQVRPRSGLALKHGIAVLNAPGTIDSDYRGELKVILTNFGRVPFVVNRGDRIAQLVISPVAAAEWDETDGVDDTRRGAGGFGHTGK